MSHNSPYPGLLIDLSSLGFPGGIVVKKKKKIFPPANAEKMQETSVRSLGGDDPLEEEVETYSNILAWGIPWTEEPGGVTKESDTTEGDSKRASLSSPSLHHVG